MRKSWPNDVHRRADRDSRCRRASRSCLRLEHDDHARWPSSSAASTRCRGGTAPRTSRSSRCRRRDRRPAPRAGPAAQAFDGAGDVVHGGAASRPALSRLASWRRRGTTSACPPAARRRRSSCAGPLSTSGTSRRALLCGIGLPDITCRIVSVDDARGDADRERQHHERR